VLNTFQWFTIALILIGSLALVAIAAPVRRLWKVFALVFVAMFLPISYLAAVDLLSRPKPLEQELLQGRLDSAVVLSSLI